MPKQWRWNEKQYQIYALIDPRDNTIRYIGKSDDAQYRYYQHLHSLGGGRQQRYWISELKKLGLSPIIQILETIDATINDAHKVVLQREQYWIDKLVRAGAPLINILGITRTYPQERPSKQRMREANGPEMENRSHPFPIHRLRRVKLDASWPHRPLVSTNIFDFSKLLENMPANLFELARLADVSERSIMRMRDGESVLRGTANKVLRGLSQIYGQTFTLDNVTGINLYDR
jgi:hypothetical protein